MFTRQLLQFLKKKHNLRWHTPSCIYERYCSISQFNCPIFITSAPPGSLAVAIMTSGVNLPFTKALTNCRPIPRLAPVTSTVRHFSHCPSMTYESPSDTRTAFIALMMSSESRDLAYHKTVWKLSVLPCALPLDEPLNLFESVTRNWWTY